MMADSSTSLLFSPYHLRDTSYTAKLFVIIFLRKQWFTVLIFSASIKETFKYQPKNFQKSIHNLFTRTMTNCFYFLSFSNAKLCPMVIRFPEIYLYVTSLPRCRIGRRVRGMNSVISTFTRSYFVIFKFNPSRCFSKFQIHSYGPSFTHWFFSLLLWTTGFIPPRYLTSSKAPDLQLYSDASIYASTKVITASLEVFGIVSHPVWLVLWHINLVSHLGLPTNAKNIE